MGKLHSIVGLVVCSLAAAWAAPLLADPVAAQRLTTVISVAGVFGPEGTIYFASNRNGNDPSRLGIWSMRLDGTGPRELISGPGSNDQVAVSPDGKRVAFVSDRTGNLEIWVADIDGGSLRQVTDDPGENIHPNWSPDGRRLLFNSTRDADPSSGAERYEIYEADLTSGALRKVTDLGGVNTYASWSPDGRKIVFRGLVDGAGDIFVVDADGSRLTNLTRHSAMDGWPTWSPDGRQIAFASNRDGAPEIFEIYLMDSDGSNQRRLSGLGGRSTSPAFSRDGRNLLFTRSGGGWADLHVISLQ